MIGMLLIAIVLAWIGMCAWIAHRVGNLLPAKPWRRWLKLVLCALLIPIPVIDEIIGGFQFRTLCQKNTELKVDAKRIKGKTVRVDTDPLNEDLSGKAISILHSRILYKDAFTNEELATANSYVAKGGWLVRTLGMDSNLPPLLPMTFRDSSTCRGPSILSMSEKYGFTYQSNPQENK